ncbi:polynucleotide adenylyltransferase PcnB [Psychrobium sp. 1_MG-2023]|uniref:polynucleotide adenylyltransferase PcnB n=1 Tax=Psychrobium sp. 1_MG-2023 TaxID=3062624 RepID=UPI000C31BE5E|nr:polynucleotide adenylyltransferase PcnB [Psychrobium sp. 1_MG-2023]MDP2561489.1 polynucleotide adenylyltransferase PcnB [Psychrobium sp. 1_MG-2023]PKF57755.1 polynucleotide adenylyltransferase PcnB [Alteromonadales bacterium alter-6D02]
MGCVIFSKVIGLCRKVIGSSTSPVDEVAGATTSGLAVETIPREQHVVSRSNMSVNAIKVLNRLNRHGYKAYLVGGGVRDLLLGHSPKDFDIATNATPEQIKELFKNCRLIGRRFRLAHILFGREVIEVATLRGHHQETDEGNLSKQNDSGMLLRDNVYGTIDEDAERRDFTVNALYYDIADHSIIAYGGGINDLNNGTLRMIGDPATRYKEDPVRMLRAIRFATKLNMTISEETRAPIKPMSHLMKSIPAARLFEEYQKLFLSGKALDNYKLLNEYQLFESLFPMCADLLEDNQGGKEDKLFQLVCANTDKRIASEQRVTPAFIIAAFLWYPIEVQAQSVMNESGLSYYDAMMVAMNDVCDAQCRSVSIPKRFSAMARDMWGLQLRLPRRSGAKAFKLLTHPKFRAGYDLLLIRGEIEGGEVAELAQWWTTFQHAPEKVQRDMVRKVSGPRRKRRSPKKKTQD